MFFTSKCSLEHDIPVEQLCVPSGFVYGSHSALYFPFLLSHSTVRICRPVPHDTEHYIFSTNGEKIKTYKYRK